MDHGLLVYNYIFIRGLGKAVKPGNLAFTQIAPSGTLG